MKFLRTTLAILMVVTVAALIGCSKKDSPTSAGTTDNSQYQSQVDGLADVMTDSESGLLGTVGQFSSGLGSFTPPTKGAKAPPNWVGPTSHSDHYVTPAEAGWWSLTDTASHTVQWVRFTPDIWTTPGQNVTRVDYQYLLNMVVGTTTINYDISVYCTYGSIAGSDTTYTGGEYASMTSGTQTTAWEFTWTDITDHGWASSPLPHTCSGTFTVTGTGGFSGTFAFTNGAGTGTLSLNGSTIATYVFNANGTGTYSITGTTLTGSFTW